MIIRGINKLVLIGEPRPHLQKRQNNDAIHRLCYDDDAFLLPKFSSDECSTQEYCFIPLLIKVHHR
jgi:hypothetical protein